MPDAKPASDTYLGNIYLPLERAAFCVTDEEVTSCLQRFSTSALIKAKKGTIVGTVYLVR